MGPSLLFLLGQICYLTTGTCQACGGGGVVPQSLFEITWISKQYRVSGLSGIFLLTRNLDGEWDRVLPDASISSGPFQPLCGVKVWPSVCMVTPDFWLFRSLNQMAISAEMLTVSWNYQISSIQVQMPMKKIKKSQGLW